MNYLTKDEGAFLLRQINDLNERCDLLASKIVAMSVVTAGALVLLMASCSSSSTPAPAAQLEPVTAPQLVELERLGVCEEVFIDEDVRDCFVTLSMIARLEEGQ